MYSVLTLIWVAVIVVNQRPQLLHTRTVLRACRLESETFTFNITTKCMSLKITFKDRSIILPWQQQETRFLWEDRCQAPAFSCPPPSPEMQGQTGILNSPVKQEMCKSNIVGEHYLHDAWRLHLLLARQSRRGCCCGGLQSGQLLTLSVAIVHFSQC